MTKSEIQFILSEHWQKRGKKSIASGFKEKFGKSIKLKSVSECIRKWTLRHHGEPVLREEWL